MTSVRWNPDLKRTAGDATKPLISFDSGSGLAPVTWRERMASGPHSLHSYAIYTTFVTPLRRPDRICCGAVTQDLHLRMYNMSWMRKEKKTFLYNSCHWQDWILESWWLHYQFIPWWVVCRTKPLNDKNISRRSVIDSSFQRFYAKELGCNITKG